MHMTPALAIFVKTPALSPVKTRLAATLGSSDATRFHMLAARATAAVVQACQQALIPYWAVAEAGPETHAAWPEFAHAWQGDGNLGARLHHIYAQLQARHGCALMIGADAPQLTRALLQHALAALHDNAHPWALGPATDGGFWIFGGRQPVPRRVWMDVSYSQADTGSQLRNALAALGPIAALPRLTDVDDASDLPALAESMDALSHPLPAQRELAHWLHLLLERRAAASSS